jgi:hypothetical protein
MFYGTPFNQPLNNWNVSKVCKMALMFEGSAFNQPLDNWDVRKVKTTCTMFKETWINQSLESWELLSISDWEGMLSKHTRDSIPWITKWEQYTSKECPFEALFTEPPDYDF